MWCGRNTVLYYLLNGLVGTFLGGATGAIGAGDKIRFKGNQLLNGCQQIGKSLFGFRGKQLKGKGLFFLLCDAS